jgi:CheY-like chemotaxis protein
VSGARACANEPSASRRFSSQEPPSRLSSSRRLRAITPHLKTIPVSVNQIFYASNEPILEVIFPKGGVASITIAMKDGRMVEVATVGDEGLIGISALFGGTLWGGEAMMQACRPDVIVVDERLPDVSFEQFIHRLRDDARTANVRIIALTSRLSGSARESSGADACDLCLRIPCPPDVLALAIERLLAQDGTRHRLSRSRIAG